MDPARIAVVMGTSIGGLLEIERYAVLSNNRQYRKFPLSGAGAGNPQSLSTAVAYHIGAKGMVLTLATGCTAGMDAMLMAKMLLETNQADICIAGGSDAPLTTGCIYSFSKLGALSREKDVAEAGNPFSKETEGFVMAEGAGVLVLEREHDALRRGADIYGVIENMASKNDGESIFDSDRTGRTMTEVVQAAVGDKHPTYINSQALGLHVNDYSDYTAYMRTFGESIPITSIKGSIGHAFGASGNLQTIAALLSMEYNFIAPTIKSTGKGFEELPIAFEPHYTPVDRVAVTAHGYGGNNTCLLLGKY
ncbi:hypothetical protein N6H14_22050 [Paenibacillus sp. CC-CFT747]|nr:hypothetical protein N6H14_22050 [Paenibacillus sp. CC-CFT747]